MNPETSTLLAPQTSVPIPTTGVILSVIIVNWNTRDLLTQCLDSIAAVCESQIVPADAPDQGRRAVGLSIEVFVVDNASSDGSPEVVRERFPWARLIRNVENVGFARANNQAIELADGQYVLLLNSDTVVHPGAFDALVGFMARNPKAGAAGARLLNADGTVQPSCHPMLTPWREFIRLMFLDQLLHVAVYGARWWEQRQPRQTEVIKGACLLLRRAALEQVGLLDGAYFMYTEEVDLCYRLAEAGWQLWWVPGALVTHFGEASSRQVAQAMYVQLYRSKTQFYRKYGGERRAGLYKTLLRIAYLPRWLALALLARRSSSHRARAATYRELLAQVSTF